MTVPGTFFLIIAAFLLVACGGSGNHDAGGQGDEPAALVAGRQYRAITGISMGGYGAANIGTKFPEIFGVIGSLGGPVDLEELLRHINDIMEVAPRSEIPTMIGEDFTFDHMPPYPDRDTRMEMIQDLSLAFGNPMLHHPDPEALFLATDSEPARNLRDDRYDNFLLTGADWLDGGDSNEDGVRQTNEPALHSVGVLLAAAGSLAALAPGADGVAIGGRVLADLNGDGVYDVGDGIVLNFAEPFLDSNANLVYEPDLGESFEDTGLDGRADTGDHGEGNGRFDYDPDRETWLAESPVHRLAEMEAGVLSGLRIYMDAGRSDEFDFATHYRNLVKVLAAKGMAVRVQDGFAAECTVLDTPVDPFLLVEYDGGHVGIPAVDELVTDLLAQDYCSSALVWQRLAGLIGYLEASFPAGVYGPGGLDFTGDLVGVDVPSPALALPGGETPSRRVLVYRPPAFFNTEQPLPVVYFLGGYGMAPEDMAPLADLLDLLVNTLQIQNMCWAFVPGAGGLQGSFYANQIIPETQCERIEQPTSGRYQDSLLQDLMPYIENTVLQGRGRR